MIIEVTHAGYRGGERQAPNVRTWGINDKLQIQLPFKGSIMTLYLWRIKLSPVVRRVPKFAIVCAGLIAAASPANAQFAAVYFIGNASGSDWAGVFGTRNSHLPEQRFFAEFIFDGSRGEYVGHTTTSIDEHGNIYSDVRKELFGGKETESTSPLLTAQIWLGHGGHTLGLATDSTVMRGREFVNGVAITSFVGAEAYWANQTISSDERDTLYMFGVPRSEYVTKRTAMYGGSHQPFDYIGSYEYNAPLEFQPPTGSDAEFAIYNAFDRFDGNTLDLLSISGIIERIIVVPLTTWQIRGWEDFPMLPISVTQEKGFEFIFGVSPDQRVYVDPEVAVGYDYSIASGPLITKAIFPELAGDSDGYDIYLLNDLSTLLFENVLPGTEIDFTTLAGFADGIQGFSLLDIDLEAGIDPHDYEAFVTGLSFASGGVVEMYQKPRMQIIANDAVPEPAAWGMMIVGFGLVGGFARQRRSCIAQMA